MRRPFGFAILFLCVLGWAAYQGWHYLAGRESAEVPALQPGHQEVAWFAPATSGDGWERLVAALKNLKEDWATVHNDLPRLQVSFDDAFLDQTASIPQIALYFTGFEDAKLWIRWYKLSGEIQQGEWLAKLHKRGRAPLAVIGGDSSDQALETAHELREMQQNWAGPLFLVTSATVDRFDKTNNANDLTDPQWPRFMDVYKNRTFRFCFTNEHIAHAVLDFVHDNPQVWPEHRFDPVAMAYLTAHGNALNCFSALAANSYFQPVHLSALAWEDDRYSQDLANRMYKVFIDFFYHGDVAEATAHYRWHYVSYSVGGYYQPNPREQRAVDAFLDEKAIRAGYHHLLAVPTGVQPARRFLRTLCRRAPTEIQDLLVVTGDSISFNNVYRDGDLEWNALDMPVPLVFFSHRNPMDEAAGFRQRIDSRPLGVSDPNAAGFHTTGTHDLLLLRDIIEALVQAAWTRTAWSADPDAVRDRLRQSRWNAGRIQGASPGREPAGLPLFDDEGNRAPHTGEHVVWLQPVVQQGRNLPRAFLSVWRIDRQISDARTWERVGEPIVVNYNQAREVGTGHDGNQARSLLRFAQASLPLFIVGVVVLTLREPLVWWLEGDQIYDKEAIKEWLREARVYSTLPELARQYLELEKKAQENGEPHQLSVALKREEIFEHLKALGNPPTKMYPEQLPLFPVIYRIDVNFAAEAPGAKIASISWDSELPRQSGQYRKLPEIPLHQGATADVQYRLHAYSEKQFQERQEAEHRLRLGGLGIAFALSALGWIFLSQRRERHRELRVNEAERLRLEEELRRQEADQHRREALRQNLELRSQIFANIGIMAGSYAHNIKNLLVRPNDLLRRCLDEKLSPQEHDHLLREVKQTLATVTDRLQQILQTVRRDPGKVEKVRIDLNHLAREMCQSWQELARDKWKLNLEAVASGQRSVVSGQGSGVSKDKIGPDSSLTTDHLPLTTVPEEPLWIEGDYSHLQQALENLLFNARDATFEMRNHLREQARQQVQAVSDAAQRQALITAAAWKGAIVLRTRRQGDRAILEVQDNGIGMTEEVRRRCTETHFSTKRDNALFAGLNAGMGLGLAFVAVILEHHGGSLEIESQPLQGACFRLSLPLPNAS